MNQTTEQNSRNEKWQRFAAQERKNEAIVEYCFKHLVPFEKGIKVVEKYIEENCKNPAIQLDIMIQDRETLYSKIANNKISAFNYCANFITGTQDYRDTGYTSLQDALECTINNCSTINEKLIEEFNKKYPI